MEFFTIKQNFVFCFILFICILHILFNFLILQKNLFVNKSYSAKLPLIPATPRPRYLPSELLHCTRKRTRVCGAGGRTFSHSATKQNIKQ